MAKKNKTIWIKSMLKTPVENKARLIKEAKELDAMGANVIRCAIEKTDSLDVIPALKAAVKAKIEADVHFDPKLTLGSIRQGADIVRFNPMNISDKKAVKEFLACAKEHGTYVRIGVNSGGFQGKFTDKSLAKAMVAQMKKWVKFFEKENFEKIYLSFKAQNVNTTVLANKLFFEECNKYPMHLGVTATGPKEEGVIKSALALGTLFSAGIGDALRLSLNAPAKEEVRLAKMFVQFMGLAQYEAEIISCPTCSRTQVDLRKRVESFKKFVAQNKAFEGKTIHVALMGCVVNGPGEASQADIGIAFSNKGGKAALFKNGKVFKTIKEESYQEELLALANEMD